VHATKIRPQCHLPSSSITPIALPTDIFNVVLPLFFISSLGFTVAFVDFHEVSSRLEITLTLVLTSVAIKLTASDWLPNVAYLTLLDSYILCGFMNLVAIAIQHVVSAHLDSADFDKLSIR
jgi:hypothetical protein